MKNFTIILFIIFSLSNSWAQNNLCNKLGAWVWVIEATTCKSHKELADSLSKLGVKRVFMKVADGKNFSNWPELDDKNLVATYKNKGLEIWAWTYNYPSNEAAQAEAILRAAKTGYQGFVVDVEMEFDKDSLGLYNLFFAFDKKKKEAIASGFATSNFELRVTTWGNPIQHFFNIKAMNPFVSAYMPQTYVEQWGLTYVQNMEQWMTQGELDYKKLGATKPIYHIVANEKTINTTGALSATFLNRFIQKSGGETSIWRVPGGAISAQNWANWRGIDWKKDFCSPISTAQLTDFEDINIFPNPISSNFTIQINSEKETHVKISNLNGSLIYENEFSESVLIDSETWISGFYICQLTSNGKFKTIKLIKGD